MSELVWTIVLVVAIALFALSSVLPRYRRAQARLARVSTFHERYVRYLNGDDGEEAWLVARSIEMQRDAEAVDLGVRYVAPPPPPAIGGGRYVPHRCSPS